MTLIDIQERGAGAPLVFIDGSPPMAEHRAPLEAALSRSWRLLIVSQSSHSERCAYTMEETLEAIEAALRDRDVTEAPVVGFSVGGYRALALAVRNCLQVSKVVTVAGFADLPAEDRAACKGWAEVVEGGASLADALTQRFLSPGFAASHAECVAAVTQVANGLSRHSVAADLRALADAPGLTEHLRGLRVPVTAVVGELDAAAPVPMSQQIVAAAPRSRLEVIGQTGHLVFFESAGRAIPAVTGAL